MILFWRKIIYKTSNSVALILKVVKYNAFYGKILVTLHIPWIIPSRLSLNPCLCPNPCFISSCVLNCQLTIFYRVNDTDLLCSIPIHIESFYLKLRWNTILLGKVNSTIGNIFVIHFVFLKIKLISCKLVGNSFQADIIIKIITIFCWTILQWNMNSY